MQARPETVHSAKARTAVAEVYRLTGAPGVATGPRAGGGREDRRAAASRVVRDVNALETVQAGDVLVAEMTDPDWEPVMRRVAAIVTDKGGRTAHAAIVSREFGLPCIVGTERRPATLHDGDEVTVCCAEGADGHVYAGRVPFADRPRRRLDRAADAHAVMLIVGDPSQAFDLSRDSERRRRARADGVHRHESHRHSSDGAGRAIRS